MRSRLPSVALLLISPTVHPVPANAPAATFVERRRHPALRWLWRIAFGLLFGAWSLFLLAWLTLHWGILPRIEQWRPQIEARASQALGVPVSIGAIQVRSSGWVPAFELSDVVLKDRLQREALRLPKVSVYGKTQNFLWRDTPATWRTDAILAATQTALLPDTPAELREGWIRVAPDVPDAAGGEGEA